MFFWVLMYRRREDRKREGGEGENKGEKRERKDKILNFISLHYLIL
jgi:hypothetical protein